MKERAILTLKNITAAALNKKILKRLAGEPKTYLSNSKAESDNGVDYAYPTEFLQSQDMASLCPHELTLKKHATVMLLRNIQPAYGLANGTRMKVLRMGERFIEVMILGGEHHGLKHCLFKISANTTEGELPFVMTRHQFPIWVCFAITINKSQGQSLGKVVVDLSPPPFSHGQLYVALSRVTDVANLSVLLKDNTDQRTMNVVWPEVLIRGPPAPP